MYTLNISNKHILSYLPARTTSQIFLVLFLCLRSAWKHWIEHYGSSPPRPQRAGLRPWRLGWSRRKLGQKLSHSLLAVFWQSWYNFHFSRAKQSILYIYASLKASGDIIRELLKEQFLEPLMFLQKVLIPAEVEKSFITFCFCLKLIEKNVILVWVW